MKKRLNLTVLAIVLAAIGAMLIPTQDAEARLKTRNGSKGELKGSHNCHGVNWYPLKNLWEWGTEKTATPFKDRCN